MHFLLFPGIDRHLDNVRGMMGYIWPRLYWKIMIAYVTPTLILFVLIMVLVNFKSLTYNEYVFPAYADGIGWAMTLASVLMIPAFALYELAQVWKGRKSYKEILNPEVVFKNQQKTDVETFSTPQTNGNHTNGENGKIRG